MLQTLTSSVSDSSTDPTWWLWALSANSCRISALQPAKFSAMTCPASGDVRGAFVSVTGLFIGLSLLVVGSDVALRAAVDAPFGGGDLARERRHEVCDNLCDIVGLAHPASEQWSDFGHDAVDRGFLVYAPHLGGLVAEAARPVVQRGTGGSGDHDVRPDSLGTELGGQGFGQRQQRKFGRRVVEVADFRQPRGVAAEVDEAAATARKHGGHRSATHAAGGVEVEAEGGQPLLVGDLQKAGAGL